MTQYRDEAHAVSRAINCGEGKPKPALWQSQYSSGYQVSAAADCDHLAGIDKLLGDSMTAARIKRSLPAVQFDVLVAKYSGSDKDQIAAINRLAGAMDTRMGPHSRILAAGSWAAVKYRGPVKNWDMQEVTDKTLRQWRREAHKWLAGLHESALASLADVLKEKGLTPGS